MNSSGPCTRSKLRRLEQVDGRPKDLAVAGPSKPQNPTRRKLLKSEIAPKWVGEVLQTNDLIVSRIFQFLSAHSLSKATQVCRLWNDCSQRAKKHRLMVEHFYTIQLEGLCKFDKKLFGQDLATNLRQCHADPKLVMIFTTQDVTEKGHKYFENFAGTEAELKANVEKLRAADKFEYDTELSNHISTMLPPGTLLQLCNAWGVVGTDLRDGPVEYEISDGLAAVFFSDFPDVKFHPFRVLEPKSYSHRLGRHKLVASAGLARVKNAKAMIAFSDGVPDSTSDATYFVDEFLTLHPGMALAGAAVFGHGVKQSRREVVKLKRDQQTVVGLGGVVIEGDVKAASVVLDHECRGVKAVEKKLSVLKSFPIVPGRTVAFMFSCSGRGQFYHHGVNVEAGIFGSLFPKVPLLGLFGSGEFGIDSHVFYDPWAFRDFKHVYTTVMMIITFNPPKDNNETRPPN